MLGIIVAMVIVYKPDKLVNNYTYTGMPGIYLIFERENLMNIVREEIWNRLD